MPAAVQAEPARTWAEKLRTQAEPLPNEKNHFSPSFEKYDDTINKMHSVAEVEAFPYDFRLRVNLMMETKGELA